MIIRPLSDHGRAHFPWDPTDGKNIPVAEGEKREEVSRRRRRARIEWREGKERRRGGV